MRKSKIILLIIFISFGTVFAEKSDHPWKLKINKKGIKIYNRKIDGSQIKEFLGKCTIDSSIYVLGMVLMDFPSYVKWVDSCKKIKRLSCKDDTHCIVYYVMGLPWPVSDRDVVFNAYAKLMLSKGMIISSCNSIPDSKVPVAKDCVRIKSMHIKWVFKKISENETDVTFLSWADPAGNIPAFIANMASSEFPYNTLLGLMRMSKLPKYIEAAKKIKKQSVPPKHK